jgi:hypothetical protein
LSCAKNSSTIYGPIKSRVRVCQKVKKRVILMMRNFNKGLNLTVLNTYMELKVA